MIEKGRECDLWRYSREHEHAEDQVLGPPSDWYLIVYNVTDISQYITP
jgi:hypothetical protein